MFLSLSGRLCLVNHFMLQGPEVLVLIQTETPSKVGSSFLSIYNKDTYQY